MDTRFYLMCYRFEALVASQLPPEQFGSYMAVGTRKRTSGRVMFFEIDAERIDRSYFPVEAVQAHEDGSPRKSQYLSVYRVMEHIPLDAFGKLHLVTQDGLTLGLDGAPAPNDPEEQAHMYVELCPVGPRVVSELGPAAFAKFMTDPENALHFPRLFFADQLIEREADGSLASYLPYRDHAHILDCIEDLGRPGKKSKTVDRLPPLVAFYRTIKTGFYVGDPTGCRLYRFPSADRLDDELHRWWRSAQLG